jgi:creatinine amidohydrolase
MLHGWIPPARFLPYLSSADIAALPDAANTVIVQPVAAIEQHGPHLPIAVDTVITCGVLGRAFERLSDAVPAYALPPLCYGKSNEHVDFPGTISLSTETLLATLHDVAESLYRSGFRKLALVNGHGGQPQVLELAARDARERHRDLSVFPLFVWRVPHCAAELFPEQEQALGIHAGAAETSLLMALLPDTVDMHRAVTEYPHGLSADSVLSMEGALPFAWLTSDLSASGVLGDPLLASPEKGARLLDSLADGWARTLADIHRFVHPAASRNRNGPRDPT